MSQIPHSPQEKLTAEWYPLVRPQQKAVGGDIITVSAPSPAAATTQQPAQAEGGDAPKPIAGTAPSASSGAIEVTAVADDKSAVGAVRLQLLVRTPEPEALPHKGIAHEGEWRAGLNGGNIIANPWWYENPQYLLTVGSASTVTISLNQPADANEQATFYVLRYNDALYRGRRKPLFNVDDVVKIEGDFLSPVFAANVEQAYKLDAGQYCVIPCTSFKAPDASDAGRHCGRFVIAANATPLEKIAFAPLPADAAPSAASAAAAAAAEAVQGWTIIKHKGSWTEATSGGADVSSTLWTKNPQFLVTLNTKSPVCFALHQAMATRSIGIYVMAVEDTAHKPIAYRNEVAATSRCAFSCAVGAASPSLAPGAYVVIPCTYEPHTTGDFELLVFCADPAVRVEPFTRDWAHRRGVKGRWEGESAGGSPNHATFTRNPQFALTLDPKGEGERQFVVQLVQHRTKASTVDVAPVGIVVLSVASGKASSADLRQENVVCQTEGWTAQRSVSCTGKVVAGNKTRLIVIPSTFNPAMEHKFTLTVFSDSELSLVSAESD